MKIYIKYGTEVHKKKWYGIIIKINSLRIKLSKCKKKNEPS